MQRLGVKVGAPAEASVASARIGTMRDKGKTPRTARKRKQQQLAQQPLVYRLVTRAELGRLFEAIPQENTGWLKPKECRAALSGMMAKARQAMAETQAKEREGFNPSKNPNPEDLLWRAQRVAAWKAKGGTIPDASWKVAGPARCMHHPRMLERRSTVARAVVWVDSRGGSALLRQLDAARKAMAWYQVLQSDDGHWAGGAPSKSNGSDHT